MAHAALSQSLFCLQLQPGQTAWEILPRSADITVMEGSIVVHQRRLLADTWVRLPVLVQAGEHLRVSAGGWVELEATSSAQVHGMVTPAWWQTEWLGWALRMVRPTSMAS